MCDTHCVVLLLFSSHSCLRLSEENTHMDRHYCPYSRVNTPHVCISMNTHIQEVFYSSRCLYVLLLL